MRFTSEQRLDDDVLERELALGEIPGILWMPASASTAAPVPLILLGHPGGLGRMYPRRQLALDLFDAFGSREKTLQANLGGHTGVPPFAGDDAGRFFARHLR
ncbi:hypothetical protein [Cellulosimicrobium arenosum]|uniref:Alpha/beta hydrolase n=1 Tax=Cellulosimicrobium arenosum TaxID=2708133 RepID=A0A927IXX8_9MICO|nr:hypothetical protein [Cellulosimicrobium arenosum]MBD8078351.1 hypothetical protein [Cellulosimicrobium arenosum]